MTKIPKYNRSFEQYEHSKLKRNLLLIQRALKNSETRNQAISEKLNQSEEKYRRLIDTMDDAFCIIEMIFDKHGNPVDFLYLETNPAFVVHAGQPMQGKRILEIVPDFEQFWLDQYGHVATTGDPVRLEHRVRGLGDQWFRTSATRVGGRHSRKVAVLFVNVSKQKRSEKILHKNDLQQSFLIKLGDALSSQIDPPKIQYIAVCLLGEYLTANRVLYTKMEDDKFIVERHYTQDVQPLASGRYPLAIYGSNIVRSLLAGQSVSVIDVNKEPRLNTPERVALTRFSVGGYSVIPLLKEGRLTALMAIHVIKPRDWIAHDLMLMKETAEHIRDAVNRSRAEAAVRESEARLQMALNTAGIGTFMWCLVEDRMEPDNRMLALFGLSASDKIHLKG